MRVLSIYKTRQKLIAKLLSIIIMALLLFSHYYIVETMQHDCQEENCPICEDIEICMQTIWHLGTALIGAIYIVAWLFLFILVYKSVVMSKGYTKTLVGQKVRLNN